MSHIDPGLKPPAVSVINMTIYIRWPYCTPCPKPFAAAVMARAPREPYPTRCGAVSLKRKVTGAAMSQAVAAANNGEASSEMPRSEEHTSELQSRFDLVCRLLLEKKKN